MIEIQVELGDRAYPIWIGAGLLRDRALVRRAVPARQILVVSNQTVAPLYAPTLLSHFDDRSVEQVILEDGEAYKTLGSFERVMEGLLRARFERGCCVVALGGGVVGDLAGFAAACYQRGVDFVQIPTTLLAQVDSSVGGKTAVNHPLGKNMIGAFHQPRAVITDLDTLRTLPARELSAGLAEIIKYGLIDDPMFFGWLEEHMEALVAREVAVMAQAIERSCRDKARIVAMDERESGVRALLNLGHTFGHGIEHALGYGTWLHGEAVAAGMAMACRLSVAASLMSEADAERALALIRRAGLPIHPPVGVATEDLLSAMKIDKKNKDGRIRLVLLKGCGGAFLTENYPEDAFMAELATREES
jgi:3-dehydroquinate synthase